MISNLKSDLASLPGGLTGKKPPQPFPGIDLGKSGWTASREKGCPPGCSSLRTAGGHGPQKDRGQGQEQKGDHSWFRARTVAGVERKGPDLAEPRADQSRQLLPDMRPPEEEHRQTRQEDHDRGDFPAAGDLPLLAGVVPPPGCRLFGFFAGGFFGHGYLPIRGRTVSPSVPVPACSKRDRIGGEKIQRKPQKTKPSPMVRGKLAMKKLICGTALAGSPWRSG